MGFISNRQLCHTTLAATLLLALGGWTNACKAEPGAHAATTKAPAVVKSHKHPPAKILVPPPPPELPLIGGTSERQLSTLGVPLDYLSKTDLEKMKTRLQASELKLRKQKDEQDQEDKENRDRLSKFDDLYSQGIVSRKELEQAHRELADMGTQRSEIDEKLQDCVTDIARVDKQLASLQKKASTSAKTLAALKSGKSTKLDVVAAKKDATKQPVGKEGVTKETTMTKETAGQPAAQQPSAKETVVKTETKSEAH